MNPPSNRNEHEDSLLDRAIQEPEVRLHADDKHKTSKRPDQKLDYHDPNLHAHADQYNENAYRSDSHHQQKDDHHNHNRSTHHND